MDITAGNDNNPMVVTNKLNTDKAVRKGSTCCSYMMIGQVTIYICPLINAT